MASTISDCEDRGPGVEMMGRRFSRPAWRACALAPFSALTVAVVETIGRQVPVPPDAACGKCSSFAGIPHQAAEVGYPMVAFSAGVTIAALTSVLCRLPRRWEALAWLTPLALLGVLFVRYLQHASASGSVSGDAPFPLDGWWILAESAAVASYAALAAVHTGDGISRRTRHATLTSMAALTAVGVGVGIALHVARHR